MASNRFNLGKCLYKSVDGEGEVYEAYNTPAAQVLAAKKTKNNLAEAGLYIGYFAAKNGGLFEDMGFKPTGNDEKDMLAFFSKYAFDLENLNDDGKPLADDEDENPTTAS